MGADLTPSIRNVCSAAPARQFWQTRGSERRRDRVPCRHADHGLVTCRGTVGEREGRVRIRARTARFLGCGYFVSDPVGPRCNKPLRRIPIRWRQQVRSGRNTGQRDTMCSLHTYQTCIASKFADRTAELLPVRPVRHPARPQLRRAPPNTVNPADRRQPAPVVEERVLQGPRSAARIENFRIVALRTARRRLKSWEL